MEWGRRKRQLPKSQVARVLPPSPQRPCPVAGLLELEEREWSAVGCVEACCWVGTCLPHPFWCAGRALLHHPWSLCSGFAASWAPGGGTLPVFQKTVNHFILLGLPIADLDSPGCPSCLSVQALKTPLLLHDAQVFCLGSLLRIEVSTLPSARLASSPGKELTSLIPTLSICPILQQ